MGTYPSTTTSIIDRHDAEPQRHHSTKMILHMMWYERHPQILCSSILTLKPMVSSSNCPIRKNQYPGVTSLSVSKHHCRELTHHQTTPTPHQSSTCGGCITGRLTCTTAALSTTHPLNQRIFNQQILSTRILSTKADPHHRFVATHHYGLHSFIHTKTHVFWSLRISKSRSISQFLFHIFDNFIYPSR